MRKRLRSERGAELVEMALAMPLLLLVALGIVDFGFLLSNYVTVQNSAREGARIATLPNYGGPNVTTNVQNRVFEYLDAASLTDPARSVDVQPVTLGSGDCAYMVTVTYPHEYSFVGGIIGYFGGSLVSSTMTASSTMRREAAQGPCS